MLRRLAVPLLTLLVAPLALAQDKPAPSGDAPAAAPGDKPATPPGNKSLVFGLQRTVSNTRAQDEAAAVEGYLTQALGQPVKTKIFPNYDALSDALAKGEVDIAWVNPFPYLKATQTSPEIRPIAKVLRNGASYRAVIYVRADSKAKTLADLKGTRAAWVDKDSSSGYLYPRAMFVKSGATLNGWFSDEKFYESHSMVCQAVLAGTADFGATLLTGAEDNTLRVDGCITAMGDAAKGKFTPLVASDPIPNEVIAVRAGFDADLGEKLGSVFGQMSMTDSGVKVLKDVFQADGFGEALETDFDSVRDVAKGLARLQTSGGRIAVQVAGGF